MAKEPTKKAAKKAVTKTASKKVSTPPAAPVAAKKAAPAKKAAVAAPAPAAVVKPTTPEPAPAAKKAPAKKAATTSKPAPLTTIVAKVDVGFGNSLYLRGQGSSLSWDKGIVMGCAGPDEWVWSTDAKGDLEFKFLLNDEIWASGPNSTVAAGERIVIEPQF